MPEVPEFDAFAASYEKALSQGLGVTGEDSEFYARGRIEVLSSLLRKHGLAQVRRILDFGCGTGGARPWIFQAWHDAEYVGYDPSGASLAVAEKRHAQPNTVWTDACGNHGKFDLIFTNGVFHHIPPAGRPDALALIRHSLQPSGVFAFFENNPWNPGTRYIMSRVEFDRDAITITPRESKLLLTRNGFAPRCFASLFYFPAALAFLRPVEKYLRAIPLGGQYLHVCQMGKKP